MGAISVTSTHSRVLAVCAAGSILLAACVGEPAPPPAASPTPEPTPAISTERLVVVQAARTASMDIHVVSGADKIKRISEPLLKRDPATEQPAPHLATSWRQVGPTTWELTLREGVRFSNGEPFDADAVVFSFERIANPDLSSPLARSVTPLLASVEAVNATTVRFETVNPYAMFLERLLTVGMVPPGYVAEVGDQAFGLHPIGTGPYKFVEWVQDQHVTLERNDDYWGPAPAFRQVVYREIREGGTAVAELVTEGVHIIVGLNPALEEAVTQSGVADLVGQPTTNVLELRMDALGRGGENPFTDRRVRQAVAHAVDREAIVESLFGGHARVVATNIIPEMFGHDPAVTPYPYDPDRARELLAEAGFPDGFETRLLWFPSGAYPQIQQIAEAVASDLGRVGIRATLFSVAQAQISQYTTTGEAGPIFLGPNPNGGFYDGGFAFFFLRERFRSSYYWSDELEELIVRIEQSTDSAERQRLLSMAQRIYKEEAPYVPIAQTFELLAVNKKLDIGDALQGPDIAIEEVRPR